MRNRNTEQTKRYWQARRRHLQKILVTNGYNEQLIYGHFNAFVTRISALTIAIHVNLLESDLNKAYEKILPTLLDKSTPDKSTNPIAVKRNGSWDHTEKHMHAARRTHIVIGWKQCCNCGVTLNAQAFEPSKKTGDGLKDNCIECQTRISRLYGVEYLKRKRNTTRIRQRQ